MACDETESTASNAAVKAQTEDTIMSSKVLDREWYQADSFCFWKLALISYLAQCDPADKHTHYPPGARSNFWRIRYIHTACLWLRSHPEHLTGPCVPTPEESALSRLDELIKLGELFWVESSLQDKSFDMIPTERDGTPASILRAF